MGGLIRPARALQLVTHPAGAPDLDLEILWIALDGASDRLAQLVASVARGRRVLHHVDRERNYPRRPGDRLTEHKESGTVSP